MNPRVAEHSRELIRQYRLDVTAIGEPSVVESHRDTIANSEAGRKQRRFAGVFCALFALVSFAALPVAARPAQPFPAFLAIYQSTLVLTYAVTTYVLALQYLRSHSIPLLLIAAGCLYTAIVVFLQFLSFPGLFSPGRLFGSGPETTVWLWTFWHVGPPVYGICYGLTVRSDRHPVAEQHAAWTMLIAGAGAGASAAVAAIFSTRFVMDLPTSTRGDDYTTLITSGIGPTVEFLTLAAIVFLWRVTRGGKAVLELWLIASLVLLALDNLVTFAGAGRATIGWVVGRLEALVSAAVILGVYLRQLGVLEQRAQEAEALLLQAQKMEAIGRLTGGVAHDFNNLLTVVVGAVDMIRRKPDDVARTVRLAENALKAAERGAGLTKQLLMFARKQALRPVMININRAIRDFEDVFRRAAGEHVEVRFRLEPTLASTRVDPTQLHASLINLIVNARDAMPSGGVVTIETANTCLDTEYVEQNPEASVGPHVMIAVSDTGTGMNEATLLHAVEPFFTTKQHGAGSGLGLSQVYGFTKSSAGYLKMSSELGAGTTVRMYLQAGNEPVESIEPARPEAIPLRRALRGETILVVEDDLDVLQSAVHNIKELGYAVVTAPSARQALTILEGTDRVDILFSDIVMPGGMNGLQLAVEARRLRPDIRILLASGYTDPALQTEPSFDVPVLNKPYKRDDLIRHLNLVTRARAR